MKQRLRETMLKAVIWNQNYHGRLKQMLLFLKISFCVANICISIINKFQQANMHAILYYKSSIV